MEKMQEFTGSGGDTRKIGRSGGKGRVHRIGGFLNQVGGGRLKKPNFRRWTIREMG